MVSLSSSQLASRGYADRSRAGFLVLLYLVEHNAIKKEALPSGVFEALQEMVVPWVNMKLKRQNKRTNIVTPEESYLVFSLNEAGEKDRPDLLNKTLLHGKNLIKNGFIHIVPNEDLSEFVPKLTVTGEVLVDVLNNG